MAQLFVIPEEDYEVIRKYLLGATDMSAILVPESVLEDTEFPKDAAAKLRELDGKGVNYDFGGEPDILLDVITSKYHYGLSSLGSDPFYN